jgi:hypothetical protein
MTAFPLEFSPVPEKTHRFVRALSFDVSKLKSTVPVYPPDGVTVISSFLESPD